MPNRKFGAPRKFGTSTKFGASSGTGRTISIGLLVDWDDDSIFDGYNEATSRMLSYEITRGREFFLDSEGSGFQEVDVGRLTVTLKDTAGRYNPYNASSPLYGLLSKKQKIRIIVTDDNTGAVYKRFTGYIEDIKYEFGTVSRAVITALDGLDKLKNNIKSTSVQTTVQYDDMINTNLDLAGWKDGKSVDSTASDTMSYYWTRGRTAFSEITELVNAARGLFFVNTDGAAVYLSALSSAIPAITLNESDIDYYYGVRVPAPREIVRNKVRVYARARKSNANVEIWRAVDKPAITTTSDVTMWADYSYNSENVPATAIITPVATTDFTVHANADGTGTDYTANTTVTMTTFATTAKLVFHLASGGPGYITLAKLRGTVISADNYTFAEKEDTNSQAVFGIREMVLKSDWLQDLNAATDQAFVLTTQLSNPRQFPRVLLRNKPTKQFSLELFDPINVNFPTFGINNELRIGFISETWSIEEPSIVNTTIYTEPNLSGAASGAWIFTAIFGATTVFA